MIKLDCIFRSFGTRWDTTHICRNVRQDFSGPSGTPSFLVQQAVFVNTPCSWVGPLIVDFKNVVSTLEAGFSVLHFPHHFSFFTHFSLSPRKWRQQNHVCTILFEVERFWRIWKVTFSSILTRFQVISVNCSKYQEIQLAYPMGFCKQVSGWCQLVRV